MKYIWGGIATIIASFASLTYASSYATLGDFLTTYVDHFDDDIPESYQYIQLYFQNIQPDSELYPVLQKAVYLDMIANKPISLDTTLLITKNSLAQIMAAHRGQQVVGSSEYVTVTDLDTFVASLPDYRAYYCSIDGGASYDTLDISDFSLVHADNFAIMDDVYQRLTTHYLYRDQVQHADLIAGAIQGMVDAAGDDYTTYFLPAETEVFQSSLKGEYSGIGIVVEPTEEGLVVVSPLQGSPAQKAGVQPDDLIIIVDGTTIAGMGADAADFILGPAGTTVQLTIRRGDKTIRVSIIRQQITIQMVSDRVLENGDYYIALTNFGYGSAADIVDALQRYTDSRATDLIIDLRHNPGGSVGELEAMLDVFLPTNSKAFTLRGEGYDYTYTTKKSSLILPLSSDIILLVDSGSASAAEMLALVLQDYGIATLVGETTFGKGTAQSIIDYDDGSSFKYTVYERFSSRSNTSINHQGVKPDYTITLDENYDNQLEYAKKL